MVFRFLHLIPDDILYCYIWPNISNNIKIQLNKQLFYKYYQQYYDKYCINKQYNALNIKYLSFLIKNDIKISLSYLLITKNINIYTHKKLYYNNIIFFNYHNFLMYLSKKYKSCSCQYILNNYSDSLTQMNIKEYKNYNNKNIRWIK